MDKKFKQFMEEHKEITLLGLAWALFWRLYVVILAVAFVIGLISSL